MKVFKITAKNLKLLMRSKTSMLVVVFGPLIIMLLVGFAFNNNSASRLNIGYYSDKDTSLTTSFIDALKGNPSFTLVKYDSDVQCIDMIEQGKVHLCIIFPNDFSIENNKTNELQFYVDQSRANFVYAVIDTVSSKVSLTSSQLSYQMTNDLITVIDHTKRSNDEELSRILKIQGSVNDISKKLDTVSGDLEKLDFSSGNVDVTPIQNLISEIETDMNNLKSEANSLVTNGNTYLGSSGIGSVNANATTVFKAELNQSSKDIITMSNSSDADIESLASELDNLIDDVDVLNQKLSEAKKATGDSSAAITANIKSLSEVKTNLEELKSLAEKSNAEISALKVTNAQSIVNPIQTTIKPVSSKSGNLSFIFPYFIILIIVFIGIMLSSNIIIMEKTSKAYFRNFTTPTKDLTFVMSVFFTSFFVVLLQLTFILALAYFFLNTSLFANLLLTLILVLAAISLFTLIGMIIGYAFNNQDSVTMASISISSALLFLSNLVLPLESMSPIIQQVAKYNPYVVCSELLKKLIIFESSMSQVYADFILIFAYIIVLFVLVMLVEKASKIQFISKKPITKQLVNKKDKPIERYFKLRNGVLLMSEKDLLEELDTMTDKEFELYVNKKHNDFQAWLEMNNNVELAAKVGRCMTRKDMMAALGKARNPDPLADTSSEDAKPSKEKKK